MPKKPLVIFVAESDHSDMSYGSLVEQIIKTSEEQGLSTQVFSEFPTQGNKQEEYLNQGLINRATNDKTFADTTEFLDTRFTPIGDISSRRDFVGAIYDEVKDLSSTQLKEHFISDFSANSDGEPEFPKLSQIFKNGVFKNFDELTTTFHQEIDKEIAVNPDAPPQKYEWWLGGFNSRAIHEEMVDDLRKQRSDSDVVIIIAGSPHIPELGYLLESDYPKESRLVVSNKNTDPRIPFDRMHVQATDDSLGKAGKLIPSFELDSNGEAEIPEQISQAITEKARDVELRRAVEGATSAIQHNGGSASDAAEPATTSHVDALAKQSGEKSSSRG